MKCFAGCTSAEIVATLGLRLADLFFDVEYDPQARHIAAIQRDHERRQREAAADKRGRFIDGCKHADQFIESRQGLDISNWSEDRLDRELNLLADAYTILEHDPYAGC
ncbi:MAG: hypothetical protein NW202_13075 [Nitrospira sp.]|nr:hypothetical protein [Nitrospira sp.]